MAGKQEKPDSKSCAVCDADAVSRRSMLGGAAFAAGVAAMSMIPMRATAQQKIAQSAVKYQAQPKGNLRCDGCSHFQPPHACQLVAGTISPSGWCMLYAPKS